MSILSSGWRWKPWSQLIPYARSRKATSRRIAISTIMLYYKVIMLPVLLDLKFIKIYTYGIFLVLGFFWSTFILWRNIRLTSYKEEEVFDGLFLSIASGLFFGRLVYVVLNFDKFGFDFFKFILVNGYPGFSIWGVLFGLFLSLYLFFSSKKVNFFAAIDYFMTPLFIAAVFGKLGSFFSGAEVGEKTNFILKTKYLGFDGFRHLTPLYEGLVFIAIAFLAQKVLLEIRKEKYFPGFLFYLSLWYFSLTYFVFDKIKANHLYFQGYSFNRVVSAILLLTITVYFIYYFRSSVIEFLKKYGQKITKKIHLGAKGKTGERKK